MLVSSHTAAELPTQSLPGPGGCPRAGGGRGQEAGGGEGPTPCPQWPRAGRRLRLKAPRPTPSARFPTLRILGCAVASPSSPVCIWASGVCARACACMCTHPRCPSPVCAVCAGS